MADYALIGDIGGTNARFALTDVAAARPAILWEHTDGDSGFNNLRDAARHYLDSTGVQPTRAVLAVASPVEDDAIRMGNRGWSATRGELRAALGIGDLRLINDFAAIAWAAPHLTESDLAPMRVPPALPLQGPITLFGAGTGLGVALLTGSPGQGWHVIPTEGGHAGYAPTDAEERAIAGWLGARFGRVSGERALSGAGLSCIDAALRGIPPAAAPAPQPGARSASAITAAALEGNDEEATRALDRFCRIYGAVAGDAALLHGAATVLIAGGMVLHFLDFFRASGFVDAFTAKGRDRSYMQRMAVHVITHPNPGLLGAAAAARVG